MPDPRSVMKEYRTLADKRAAKGLTAEEQARFDQLRDLVGGEAPPAPRAGFDVNAAAAQLRESLLPAGLRNRPPPTPPPPAVEPEPEPVPADDTIESVFAQAPFSPLEAPRPEDALFDPASLGETGVEPGVAAYDPNAPYDPNAAAAWDPNAPYDPNAAAGYDPNAPYDPNAAAYDPNAAAAWDPNAPYDPNAAAGYDPNAPYDPNAAAYDPNAAAALEAGAAAAPEGEPWRTDVDVPTWDPNAAPEAGVAAEVPLDAGALPPAGWDAEPPQPEPPPPGVLLGEYDETGGAPAAGMAALAVEEDAGLASRLPFDAAAASEVPAGALPEGYETPPALGEYDDTAGLTAPVPPEAAADELLFAPAAPTQQPQPLVDLTGWQPDAALDEGFQLASGGSFGARADAAAPEWAQQPETPPWENAPPLDLAAAPEAPVAEDAAYYEVEPAQETEAFAGAPPETLEQAPEAGAPAPELDYSQPDFSAEEPADAGGPGLSMAELLAAPAPELPPEPAPGAELEALPPEADLAPPVEAPPLDLGAVEGEPAPEAARFAEPEPVFAEPEPVFAEPEPVFAEPEPGPELAEAAAEMAETLAEVAEAPAEMAPEVPAEAQPLETFAAGPAEPGDLTFDTTVDFTEGAAALAEEEIPTLEEADIIEEIADVGDGAAAPPPQSLDFGALESVAAEPEPFAEPAPAVLAPPPPLAVAPPPLAVAPPPLAVAPPPVLAPPPPAPSVPPRATPAPFAALSAVPPRATPQPFPAVAAQPVPPAPEPPPPPPAPSAEPRCHVDGSHRVVVHTVEGQVKRGVLADADLDGADLDLVSQPSGKREPVPVDKVKAIFFMLAPGESPPAPEGKKVRVTFRDGRQVAGFSPDYDETGVGFFMIPGDTRTNTGRIWVYRAAVRQVAVS